jgi:tetratricopeptide (TPR) repeat protein
LAGLRKLDECLRFGIQHVDGLQGAALPADFSSLLLRCAEQHGSATLRQQARAKVIARLEKILETPGEEMAPDDVADGLRILAGAYAANGDKPAPTRTHERQLGVMERAAGEAKTPAMAATYDYQRANAYLALGQPEKAVSMLQKRMDQLPNAYEPAARLASIFERMKQPAKALEALEGALASAYGPRRLGYLAQKARLCVMLGRRADQVEALEAEVAGYEALAAGHANAQRLNDARQRLERARQGR